LRQSIKDELGKNLEAYTKADFAGFQVLIDKLKSIIDGTEVLHKEEVPAKSVAKQIVVKQQEQKAVAKKAVVKKVAIKKTTKKADKK
jgi:anionic cell wall polymer biosynthesis LytR-Cps2A-Psr (LCP) family protein